MADEKSILDGFPVDDKAFPLKKHPYSVVDTALELYVVGSCPQCGAPIYGNEKVTYNGGIPIRFSCDCKPQKDLGMRTT